MKVSMIACVGANLELGKNNALLWHLKGDLKFFKDITLNHVVVMGKNTFKSLPGVLKNRQNVVLTSKTNLETFPKEVEVLHGVDEVLEKYKDLDEIFIIGGASVYKQFLQYATKLYLTEVEKTHDADVYFPSFDKNNYEREILKECEEDGIKYNHVLYRRK